MPGRARANGEGSIFPYRNGFAAYVWVTKPDGKRTRKYVYGQTREIVHDKWIKLHQQAKAGPVATRVPTLGDYLAYWHREVVRPNLAPLTCATYETILRLYVIPGLGGSGSTGSRCATCRRGSTRWPAPASAARRARTPVARNSGGGAARSVGAAVTRRPPARSRTSGACCARRSTTPPPRNWSPATPPPWSSSHPSAATGAGPGPATRHVASWNPRGPTAIRSTPRTCLILVLGLRKGEVLGLTEDAVDLAAGELSIGWQLQRVGGQLLHRETKTQTSDATLPLPDICAAALELRQQAKRNDRDQAGIAWQGSRLLFTTRYGTPVEPRNVNRSWDARCTRAGIRKITVHDARRTCATLLVDLDVHPRVIMQVLRHAEVSVTMEIYSQASSGATRDALKRLGESLR